MAGAVIADLALENRIDTDLEALHLIDPTPTGDKLLDPTLKKISETDETLDTQYWIERNTARREEIVTVTLQRLVDKQILDYETGDSGRSRASSHAREPIQPPTARCVRKPRPGSLASS